MTVSSLMKCCVLTDVTRWMTTAQPKTSWLCASHTTTLVQCNAVLLLFTPCIIMHVTLVELSKLLLFEHKQQWCWVEKRFTAKESCACVGACHSSVLIQSVTNTGSPCGFSHSNICCHFVGLHDGTFCAYASRKCWVVSAPPWHSTLHQHLAALSLFFIHIK